MEPGLKEFIEVQINGLQKSLDEFKKENKENHEELLKHQIYTNGKVRRLEIWRAGIVGAIGVLVFLTPIVFWIIRTQIQSFNSEIDTKITAAIDANNNKYFMPLK